ncbi:hypothetical protein HJC23_012453 [Cyclotella cryptica]|uniref:Uncharacterized protein n=1 Tax=Cyclotella cryptica TaxID=29204 RepID=A0ABD3P4Y0_9STRA|eukprot:CCRYP_017475-RA/>CCRYP_017475-RA protein AED:0.38 eAED:0.38 QI:177/1/1/1/1/1/2/308/232
MIMTSAVNQMLIRAVHIMPMNPRCAIHTTGMTKWKSRPVSAFRRLSTTSSNHTVQQRRYPTRQVKEVSFSASTSNTNHSAGYFSLNQINLHVSSPQSTSRSHSSFSTFTKSEYIYPLSQIVLEHLQSRHSEWLKRMGLETRLEVKTDGTFVLRFPGDGNAEPGEDGAESIWTMYEPTEKKHYLCITKNKLIGRYLLQDNTKPAWHSDKKSTPERVQDAVDEMVDKVENMTRS